MLERLLSIMARLRDPIEGCDWDRAQTFETIAPYTIEEAYEVADAIAREDMADLKDELGDLLLQVIFHSRMAEEAGCFAMAEVIQGICDKMERRHPHIFGGASLGGRQWEEMKAAERAAKGASSALDGIAMSLPALMRAEKLQKRASRTGFDWPDPSGARAKIDEELAELSSETERHRQEDELGDLLFAVVNFARHLKIDPEAALRKANAKFERRFRTIEHQPDFEQLSLAEKEVLWSRAKAVQTD